MMARQYILKNTCLCVLLWFAGVLNTIALAEQKWVADEIFLQMSDMRKQIQQLQKQVAELEKQQAEAHPKLAPIALKDAEKMSLGKSTAKIAIIEFSDYQCPFCVKHYQTVLPKLRERYIDKGVVMYVIKDFPLEFHNQARKAALATRCAGEQRQYWAMHNVIFDSHGQITDELIENAAKQQHLNLSVFKQCQSDPKQLAELEKDMALASKLGVSGTPAFLIGTLKNHQLLNYQRLDGVQSFDTFESIIKNLSQK